MLHFAQLDTFEILIEWFFVWLGFECSKLLDALVSIFDVIVGINDLPDGTNLVDEVLTNSTVMNVFWMIFVVGVALTCIFAVVAIVQNMVTGKKTLSGIIGKLCMSLLGTLVAFCCVLLGILVCNQLLSIISNMFPASQSSWSTMLVNACVGDPNYEHVGSVLDSSGQYVKVTGNDSLLGSWKKTLGFIPTSWQNNGLVNADGFNYLEFCIASVAVLICIGVAAVNMTKRLFELVFVYLMMPAAMSVLPFDDGARMKNWTECMVSKFLTAYGVVIAINIYSILIGILVPLKISDNVYVNCVFTCLILIGGAMVVPRSQNLFLRIFGSREDATASFGPLMAMMRGARMVERTVVGGYKTVKDHYKEKDAQAAPKDKDKGDGGNGRGKGSDGQGAYKDPQLSSHAESSGSSSSSSGRSSQGTYSEAKNTNAPSTRNTNLPENK